MVGVKGVEVVVSGGQTGVDRAALDAAAAVGLPVGGWCPRGRRAEDGVIPARYALRETPGSDYAERTEWNVRDSDATLIAVRGTLTGGTRLTARLADALGRPLFVCDLLRHNDPQAIVDWLGTHQVRVLNCAGPRESGAPGIYDAARSLFLAVFSARV